MLTFANMVNSIYIALITPKTFVQRFESYILSVYLPKVNTG